MANITFIEGNDRHFRPYVMSAFDKILAAFNIHNQRGNCLYQTERSLLPMVDVSPGQAAHFFHTVEVNLNQLLALHVEVMAPEDSLAIL